MIFNRPCHTADNRVLEIKHPKATPFSSTRTVRRHFAEYLGKVERTYKICLKKR